MKQPEWAERLSAADGLTPCDKCGHPTMVLVFDESGCVWRDSPAAEAWNLAPNADVSLNEGSVDREIDPLTGQQLENYLEADEVMEEAGEEQDSHDGTEPSGFYQELLEVPPRCISPLLFCLRSLCAALLQAVEELPQNGEGEEALLSTFPVDSLSPLAAVSRSKMELMSDWSFRVWRQGLPRELALRAVLGPQMRAELDRVWSQVRPLFAATGCNPLQLMSYMERQFPYEYNLLAHAATGVERHHLVQSCIDSPLPGDHTMMTELAGRFTGRIIFAIAGTSSQREREDPDTLSPTYVQNHANGALMREISMLHSLQPRLLMPLQNALGVAVRSAVNMSELSQYLRGFQIVPDEEVSRKFLLQVQNLAEMNRVLRLAQWATQGDGWTVRLDNCDVGKLLHFVAMIATRDHKPPAAPFPFVSSDPVIPKPFAQGAHEACPAPATRLLHALHPQRVHTVPSVGAACALSCTAALRSYRLRALYVLLGDGD